MRGSPVNRSIISIRPRWEGGYDVYRGDEWAGSALTLDLVKALAQREALKDAAKGRVGLVVMQNMRGELESVLEWVDPPRDVVRIPDPVEQAVSPDRSAG
jgi:hypothetical protein